MDCVIYIYVSISTHESTYIDVLTYLAVGSRTGFSWFPLTAPDNQWSGNGTFLCYS